MSSLMDGMGDHQSPNKKPASESSVDVGRIVKIALVTVLLLGAGGLLAMNFGLIGGESFEKPDSNQLSANETLVEETAEEEEQELIRQPNLSRPGM